METDVMQWRTDDGLLIHGRKWAARADPARGIVYLVHGLGEHIGRWTPVARGLADAGYAVLGADMRGHGQSEGPRGHTPSIEALLDDIGLGLSQARSLGDGPLFLVGHSLGGSLALNYALRRRDGLAGVIASAPWLELKMQVPPWKTALGRALARLAPAVSMPNGLDLEALSRDPDVVRAYSEDPLVHDRISAGMGICLLDAGLWALAHASELSLPALLMHGVADRITSADASRRFAERTSGVCTFRPWDGFYHELHNEPERERVVAAGIEWLEAHSRR